MDDRIIVDMFFERDEKGIGHVIEKYSGYCHTVAFGILRNEEDTEEAVNDAVNALWNSIPPHRPENLRTFLGKITRQISLDRWRKNHTRKRMDGNVTSSYEELEEMLPDGSDVSEHIEHEELSKAISDFLKSAKETERYIFVRKYWYFDSVEEISKKTGLGISNVKMTLKRTRDRLASYLGEKGYTCENG